jgi:hypothetical protein
VATPKVVTDGTTEFEEAAINKFIAAGEANKVQVKVWYGRVRYTGSAWEVSSSFDSAGLTTGALAWSTNQLQMTLSGFSNVPIILATPEAVDTNLNVKAHCSSSTLAVVRFYAVADGALVSTQATTMEFNVLLIGF